MLIGLTGSIGSGKTTVAKRLRERGAHVLDADEFAHTETKSGTEGLKEVAAAFGAEIISPDGSLNREILASIVFKNEEKRFLLNAILHPRILNAMRVHAANLFQNNKNAIVVYDMPLLIETGEYKKVDRIWLVTADDEARIKRIMARDNCSREAALSRIAAQMPQAEKLAYADVVIENSDGLNALNERVDALYDALRE
jgi:dephospho-CoA kinase